MEVGATGLLWDQGCLCLGLGIRKIMEVRFLCQHVPANEQKGSKSAAKALSEGAFALLLWQTLPFSLKPEFSNELH